MTLSDLTRPIIGIENRTPQEAFDIMCDRIRAALLPTPSVETGGRPSITEALRMMNCPRPCNHRPDEFTVGECVDAGECGCVAGNGLSASPGSSAGAEPDDEPRYHSDHRDDNLGIPDDAGPNAAERIRRDHATVSQLRAALASAPPQREGLEEAIHEALSISDGCDGGYSDHEIIRMMRVRLKAAIRALTGKGGE